MHSSHRRNSPALRYSVESSPSISPYHSSLNQLHPTADTHSSHRQNSPALRYSVGSSPGLAPYNSSNNQLRNTVLTTSFEKKKRRTWFCRTIATFGHCWKPPSLETQPTEENLRLQDISASSSINGLSLSSRSSSMSLHCANLGELPKCIEFTMAEMRRATNNFSPALKIGEGGFGTVYKGMLPDGRLVAIKQARKQALGMQLSVEFHNEVTALSSIEHLNLVKLIGYLDATPERILVVEYVDNGNLRQHLDGQFGVILDLATRLDIAIDVAHAVTYLHHYADQPIIHRDIKASNILLTKNFRAKVADFGFSYLGHWGENATHVSTQVRGTAGYLDPEYLRSYQLTQKSDVYSFGVLLVELFTGRRPIMHGQVSSDERMTTKWAFKKLNEGKAMEALDPKLEKSGAAGTLVEKVLQAALQCAAPTRHQRPSMRKTTELLWNIRKEYKPFWRDRPQHRGLPHSRQFPMYNKTPPSERHSLGSSGRSSQLSTSAATYDQFIHVSSHV